uniref:Delta(3,5)-Delta(2,4)-dienoyl-CoA isomerase, mitochondrial n=1 Tax=Tetraodon nigroviridis TaxID=99883 RepID=H3DA33_TETNG
MQLDVRDECSVKGPDSYLELQPGRTLPAAEGGHVVAHYQTRFIQIPELVAVQPGCGASHVIVRGSQPSLHHPGRQPTCRVCHTCGISSSGETECHEQSFLEAGMVELFNELAVNPDCRAVVFSGAGEVFTAGIDLMDMVNVLQPEGEDTARKCWQLRKKIGVYQETFSVLERCPKPVVVAVHGACMGVGVDMITACDVRLCTQDAWFQVKEVDIGLAADVGTLQRLPRVIGSRSLVNELALTARKMYADEAKSSGLVSRVFPDKEVMMAGAIAMAEEMAARSPVAVQGTKINLLYSRDHSVAESLDYMATWNMSMLQTDDLMKSAQAAMEKKSPKMVVFSKL